MASTVPHTASRESSEFEFVSGGNGGSSPSKESGAPIKADVQSPAFKDESPSEGLFGWVKGTGGGLLSKVAEKTKSSVETVITTLDPQMKGILLHTI